MVDFSRIRQIFLAGLKGFVILFGLLVLTERLETMLVLVVFILWVTFLHLVNRLPAKRIFHLEFIAFTPFIFSLLANAINAKIGMIAGSATFLFLIFLSFMIRVVLLQRLVKKVPFHNSTMFALFVFMVICCELFLGESELGLRFKMRNLGVEYVMNKATFWAPKDFREKMFQSIREYMIDDVMVEGTEAGSGKVIYFFGGSATAGAGLENPLDAFAYQTKNLWNEKYPDKSMAVVNGGVGGYTTFQIRRLIETYMDDIKADLFVLYFGFNDTQKTYGRYTHKQIYEIMYGKGRGSGPGWIGKTQLLLGRLRTYNFLVNAFNQIKEKLQGTALDTTVRAVPIQDMEENLEAILKICKHNKIHLLLLAEAANDSEREGSYRNTHNAILRFAIANQVPFVDVHVEINKMKNASTLFLDDVHLTAEGHRRVAEMITKAIVENKLLEEY